jgi:HEAT repeat protein
VNRLTCVAVLAATLATPVAACGQSAEQLVAGAGDGTVQFHFAARAGACGNGRDFFRIAAMGYYSSESDGVDDQVCGIGPVRVVLVRDARDIIRIETHVGPLAADSGGGRDLGAVSARDAASYLLHLAATLDGRPARDAIVPAMLADSAAVVPELLALARDQARSRSVRGSAIAWAARRRADGGVTTAADVQRTLDGLVRDRNENESIREQALDAIANFDRGDGVPLMISYAGDTDPWIARQAVNALARSGDPRARQFARAALQRADLPTDSRVAMIVGIGGEYATAGDYKLLRTVYAVANTDQERSAIINTLANAGGRDNIDWLVQLAHSPTESAARRRQAVSALGRSDDPRVKDALKDLVSNGDR